MIAGLSFDALWTRFQRDERQKTRLARARKLATEELKAAWDAFDCDASKEMPGYMWPDDGPHIEDVHRVLNERGEGAYCAI